MTLFIFMINIEAAISVNKYCSTSLNACSLGDATTNIAIDTAKYWMTVESLQVIHLFLVIAVQDSSKYLKRLFPRAYKAPSNGFSTYAVNVCNEKKNLVHSKSKYIIRHRR